MRVERTELLEQRTPSSTVLLKQNNAGGHAEGSALFFSALFVLLRLLFEIMQKPPNISVFHWVL